MFLGDNDHDECIRGDRVVGGAGEHPADHRATLLRIGPKHAGIVSPLPLTDDPGGHRTLLRAPGFSGKPGPMITSGLDTAGQDTTDEGNREWGPPACTAPTMASALLSFRPRAVGARWKGQNSDRKGL
ncbi:hypothetical protein CCHR01_03992 [Colletotrichum chrysophilum]|uniref:Uncharacterized protein n=1 Tax=Colletotrichum chrysophilum TaxID=1836956 RepID=A0AAD9ELX2_9PEZI|nr:hypothetical protein CCHR01_03992 [Colletotrichum chrysophilum]